MNRDMEKAIDWGFNAVTVIFPALLFACIGAVAFTFLYSTVYAAAGPIPYGDQLVVVSAVFGIVFGAVVGGFLGREVFTV